MTEIQIDCADRGCVQITDDVITVIAGAAAMEIDGVAGMAGNLTGDIALILGRRNLSKGVNVKIDNGQVFVQVNLLLKFGFRIQDVSEGVQKRVKLAIENMTGLTVAQVNIIVCGVLESQKERRPAG